MKGVSAMQLNHTGRWLQLRQTNAALSAARFPGKASWQLIYRIAWGNIFLWYSLVQFAEHLEILGFEFSVHQLDDVFLTKSAGQDHITVAVFTHWPCLKGEPRCPACLKILHQLVTARLDPLAGKQGNEARRLRWLRRLTLWSPVARRAL